MCRVDFQGGILCRKGVSILGACSFLWAWLGK